MNPSIKTLTDFLHDQLSRFPFHNLNLLNGVSASVGGTCFDHALELKKTLEIKFKIQELQSILNQIGKIFH